MPVKMNSAPLFISQRWKGDNLPELFAPPDESITHETANRKPGADSLMHWRFVIDGGGSDSVSFTLVNDDRRIVQIVPFGQGTWNASDGFFGRHNRRGVSIENCVNIDGDFNRMTGHLAWVLAALQQMPELFDWIESQRSPQNMDLLSTAIELQHNQTAPDHKNCPTIIRSKPGLWEEIVNLANTKRVAYKIKNGNGLVIRARNTGTITTNTVRKGMDTLTIDKDGLAIHARRLILYRSRLAILTLFGTIIPLNAIHFEPFNVEGLHVPVTETNWRQLITQKVIQPAYRVRERYELEIP